MTKIFFAFLLACFTTTNLCAQNFSDQSSDQDESLAPNPSEEIWGKKQGNTYKGNTYNNSQTSKLPPLPGKSVSAPIDGGLVILIVAGALYGKRRIDQNKKSGQKTVSENSSL